MRVVKRRQTLEVRATQIPTKFAEALAQKTCEGMPASAALIGLWIVNRSREAMPVNTSLRKIAEDTGCNRITIHKALDWLKGEHLITVGEGGVLRAGHRELSINLQ